MFRPLALAGALCFALLSPVYLPAIQPAMAQEAPVCENTFDGIAKMFADAGSPVVLIPDADLPAVLMDAEKVTGLELDKVTRGFVAQSGGNILLGLELDGCLLPPILWGFVPVIPATIA